VLLFVDETWQTIGGRPVAALGAVALQQAHYNDFCRRIYSLKRDMLGVRQLNEGELKGAKCFAARAFRARSEGESRLLDAAEAVFDTLDAFEAKTFVVWTTNIEHLSLRTPLELSPAYRTLLLNARRLMSRNHPTLKASLNFDQRDLGSDALAACAVQSYLTLHWRWRLWDQCFLTVPNFTVSAVSPGLQAADLVTYLGAHCAPGSTRKELLPYIGRVRDMEYMWTDKSGRLHHSVQGVEIRAKK
jgi:hypothetical protein